MRRTIYIPDELGERIDLYLKQHPGTNLSTLVREALMERLAPRDISALLDLAGLVKEAHMDARDHPEDHIGRPER